MKKYLLALVAIVIIIAIDVIVMNYRTNRQSTQLEQSEVQMPPATIIGAAVYRCDNAKTISAIYYDNPAMKPKVPTDRSVPTGSVEVSLNGEASTTLPQTISGSGVRYANADESFVFWNKGDEALIMRNNSMDLDFKNCLSK